MARRTALTLAITSIVCAAACGGAPHATKAPARVRPAAAAKVAVTRLPDHRLLMVTNRDGVVAVDGSDGRVTFRAPYGAASPDGSTVVQAEPLVSGTRV